MLTLMLGFLRLNPILVYFSPYFLDLVWHVLIDNVFSL